MTRALVTIASYGTKNEAFLRRLLDEYQSMDIDVDLVVLSEQDRELGRDVEVHVGLPTSDPKSLPFAHRAIMAERVDQYDLFVYSEDDTLIQQSHLEAFLEVDALLPSDMVPGFLRYELHPSGERSYSSVHSCFHWDPASVMTYGTEIFARFTNDHSACFVLTRAQLKRAIASGGFLVAPHRGESSMLVTAATDPYRQCGLRRVVCVSRVEEFLLHHLPNVYLGRLGVDERSFRAQLGRLQGIAEGGVGTEILVDPAPPLHGLGWNMTFFAPVDPDLEAAMPQGVGSALAFGCCSGLVERDGLGAACRIVAIPQDEVIAGVAQTRGIEVRSPDLDRAVSQLSGERFECLLSFDVLHRLPDPVKALARLRDHLTPGAPVLVTVPNTRRSRLLGAVRHQLLPRPASFSTWGVHPTTPGVLRGWLEDAGFEHVRLDYLFRGSLARPGARAPHLLGPVLGSTVVGRAVTGRG